MLPIVEIRVEMQVIEEVIEEKKVFAIFGNYAVVLSNANELEKLERGKKDDVDDENIVMIYDNLLSDGRAVEMARILIKKDYSKPKFQSIINESKINESKINESNIILYFNSVEALVNSMKDLDEIAYHKAQILMAKKHIEEIEILTENDGKY